MELGGWKGGRRERERVEGGWEKARGGTGGGGEEDWREVTPDSDRDNMGRMTRASRRCHVA